MRTMTIDGKPVAAEREFDVTDPALGTVTAQAPDCTPEQLDRAVTAAAHAQRAWRADEDERRAAMLAFADAIEAALSRLTSRHLSSSRCARRPSSPRHGFILDHDTGRPDLDVQVA